MNKILIALLILSVGAGATFASDAMYERSRPHEIKGWSVSVRDADIDVPRELITQLSTTYAQLAAEDRIKVGSSSASDSGITVTVTGISTTGTKLSESFTLTGDTLAPSVATFRYIDQVEADQECVGIIAVRRLTGETFITSIPSEKIVAGMAQHFSGQYDSYVTNWSAITETSTGLELELRWYPDDADSLDASDGYKILDRISIATHDTVSGNIVLPVKCPKGGWIAVYGGGAVANKTASVLMQGYDARN